MSNVFLRKRKTIKVDDPAYQTHFDKRNIKHAVVHETPIFRYPTAAEFATLQLERHIWTSSDNLTNLASKHYGDPTLWKVIAFINKKPTDAMFKPGDVVYIPKPLERVLALIGG